MHIQPCFTWLFFTCMKVKENWVITAKHDVSMTSLWYSSNKQCDKGIDCHLLCMEGVWCMALLIVSAGNSMQRQATACRAKHATVGQGRRQHCSVDCKVAPIRWKKNDGWERFACAGHISPAAMTDSARGIDGVGGALVTKRRRGPAAGVRLNLVKLMVTTSCPGCSSCRQIQASGRRSSCSATSIGTGERGAGKPGRRLGRARLWRRPL
jgi:hypothetical protein